MGGNQAATVLARRGVVRHPDGNGSGAHSFKAHLFCALLLGAVSASVTAQTKPPLAFSEQVARAESVLEVGPAGVGGPAAPVLTDAVGGARYVLIGEAHFSLEIPRFTVALCHLMAPKGLSAMAVETGPEAARIVNADLRRTDRRARLSAFMRAHPDAIAFQNNAAESDMAAACAREAGPAFRIWGLDHEFFGAAGFLLDEMAAASPGPAARAAIDRLRVKERTGTTEAVASRSPGKFLIYTVTDQEMESTRAAVAKDGGPRASRLFEALAESRAIFLASASGAGDPNGRRARLIKRTLAAYLQDAPAGSRVLMKFGDVHTVKGLNALRQRDLGNFVAEWAEGEGVSSLHILVLGAGGQLGGYNGVGRQVKVNPYTPTTDADYPWLKDALANRPVSALASDWLLIDLRRLRGIRSPDMPVGWREVIQGYDLVVIAPKLTPASLVGVDDAGS